MNIPRPWKRQISASPEVREVCADTPSAELYDMVPLLYKKQLVRFALTGQAPPVYMSPDYLASRTRTLMGATQIALMEYSKGMEDFPRHESTSTETGVNDNPVLDNVVSFKKYFERRRNLNQENTLDRSVSKHPAGSTGKESAWETIDRINDSDPDEPA